MLHKDYTASVQLENKITGRQSQGVCRQDEIIGGKPPIVKYLTHSHAVFVSSLRLSHGAL
jgi:hypothetical protein